MKDRRDLLKRLMVGSAWAAPAVSSVVLPVHAQTTGEPCTDICITVSVSSGNTGGGGGGLDFLDSLCNTLGSPSTGCDPEGCSNEQCFENLLPGASYFIQGSGGASGGSEFTVTVQCCEDEFTIGPYTTNTNFSGRIDILTSGGCTYVPLGSPSCGT